MDKKIHKNSFVNSLELAKVFLKNKEWECNERNCQLGFAYEWEVVNSNFEEEEMFKGIYFVDNNVATSRIIDIPIELYDLRTIYNQNIKLF